MNIYNLSESLNEEYYRKILKIGLEYCGSFLFVIRPELTIGNSIQEILEELDPFLIKKSKSSKWPGTELMDEKADVYSYNFNYMSYEILNRKANSFSMWNHPDFPEDLCLMRDNSIPWFVSVSHENDGYFVLKKEEVGEIEERIGNGKKSSSIFLHESECWED